MTHRLPARLHWALILLLPGLIGCAPSVNRPRPATLTPQLASAHFVTSDRATLPVRRWLPDTQSARAAIVALHGFNDYSRAFAMPCEFLRRQGIACYAYDQRGFGLAPGHGLWHGAPVLTSDLTQFVTAVRQRHPGVPLFVLGESMGAAIAIVAVTGPTPPKVDGLILSAPAIWARDTMPWYQRALLEIAARSLPGLRLTGEGLGILASDNLDMLRGLGRDPLVIKATRVDAIYGLANLMDEAMRRVATLETRTLILIGERDEVIPQKPLELMLKKLPAQLPLRVASYERGYHLLLRDLQAEKPWRDIAAWIEDPAKALPSGSERGLMAAHPLPSPPKISPPGHS